MKTIPLKNSFCQTLCVVLTGLAFASCSDLLTEETYGKHHSDTYFENTEKLEMAVNGVYAIFNKQATYGQYWMVYDCDTDISHISGAGTGHVARDLGHYNAYTEHSWLQETWIAYYEGIDRANTILAKKDDVKIADSADQKRFDRLIAQTKTLRAMCFFDLTLLWGDVPMKLTPSQASEDFMQGQTPRDEVYAQIVTDLEEAIPDLLWHDDPGQYAERISKGAAMGLLARAYLYRGGYSLHNNNGTGIMKRPDNYQEYYQKAQTVLNELIHSGKHGLLEGETVDGEFRSGYEKTFRNMCETTYNAYENICELSFFTPTGQNYGSFMGTYNGPAINDQSIYGRANSFIKTHCFFYDTFEENDLRKEVAVATFEINAASEIKQIDREKSQNWAPGKWRRNWHTGAVKGNNDTDVNWVLLRYPDVLLMSAEVENELTGGPNDTAIERVNQVRRRAFGKPYLTKDTEVDLKLSDFSGKEDFFTFLTEERARELCFEGLRRQDLIRWNLIETAIRKTHEQFLGYFNSSNGNAYTFRAGEFFTPGKHELYPIPAREIRETKGALVQNPGYTNAEE
ncbi:MAG: RagB/SusD family nutrient uptake outer membrane protein [Bacteroides sp.]|nr:RagB/SusD family nutrient uptake outer membrane protein [Bacteroides sp.]